MNGKQSVPWGWAGTISEFLETDALDILAALKEHHRRRFPDFELGHAQISAWIQSINQFQTHLEQVTDQPGGKETVIVFEYELPMEGGRRPDVVIVTPSQSVFVIECKNKDTPTTADFDQAYDYQHDLERFHAESHDTPIDCCVE